VQVAQCVNNVHVALRESVMVNQPDARFGTGKTS